MRMPKENKKGFIVAIAVTIIVVAVLLTAIVFEALRGINSWFENNTMVFDNPVHFELSFSPLVEVKAREKSRTEVVDTTREEIMKEAEKFEDKDLARYICEKFGADCKTALAVAKAESGMRCDAYNINTNGTIDIGVFQINMPIHKKRISLADAWDCKKNVDVAYEIFSEQGFKPWVAYLNQSYLAHYSK